MSRTSLLLGLWVLGTGLAWAQAPQPGLAAGSNVNAQLKSNLDTRHAKVGDKVTAVTSSDLKENGVKVLPKGSTLTGHVTEVTRAESSKSPSRIGVLFDQALTKHGQTVPLRAGIASVLTSPASAAAMGGGINSGMDGEMGGMRPMGDGAMAMPAGGGGGGGGLLGGAGATAGAVTGPVLANGAGMEGGELGAAGRLSADASVESLGRASNGVPIEIAMSPAGAQAGQQAALGSVLSTPRGDMELNSGTNVEVQMLSPSASAAGSASASGHAHAR